jgi:hypothetical protein
MRFVSQRTDPKRNRAQTPRSMNPAAAVAVSLAAKTGAAQTVLEKPVH